jgi:hypothetical protein
MTRKRAARVVSGQVDASAPAGRLLDLECSKHTPAARVPATYEPKSPYVYKALETDDPRGEKYGVLVEHQVRDRDGAVTGRFLTEGTARYWVRVMNAHSARAQIVKGAV